MRLINKWHSFLDMPKRNFDWHKQDIEEEMVELIEARGIFSKWSELSDVVYTYTRAIWSGHKDFKFPLNKFCYYLGLIYMFPKYTLRWKFFRKIGKSFDKNLKITEVRNPEKIEKLDAVAEFYGLDKTEFKNRAKKLLKTWILLK